MTNLVVNWHITEACNYKCFYCFAKWQKNENKEIIHNNEKSYNQLKKGEFKHEVRQFEKSYDNQQAEQISLMV